MEAPICELPAAIAAVSCRLAPPPHLRIRRYRPDSDMAQVQELERSCADFPSPNPNPNPNPNPSFAPDSNPNPTVPNPTDLFLLATSALGDPLARVCTYPSFCMMVGAAGGGSKFEFDDHRKVSPDIPGILMQSIFRPRRGWGGIGGLGILDRIGLGIGIGVAGGGGGGEGSGGRRRG
jgi:hypothetical protein